MILSLALRVTHKVTTVKMIFTANVPAHVAVEASFEEPNPAKLEVVRRQARVESGHSMIGAILITDDNFLPRYWLSEILCPFFRALPCVDVSGQGAKIPFLMQET